MMIAQNELLRKFTGGEPSMPRSRAYGEGGARGDGLTIRCRVLEAGPRPLRHALLSSTSVAPLTIKRNEVPNNRSLRDFDALYRRQSSTIRPLSYAVERGSW